MSVSLELRDEVRKRARRTCEYCGVTEAEVGSELTLDHFRPDKEGGQGTSENLVYACHRCNEHKGAYWPKNLEDLPLWNPRLQTREEHFIQLMDGTLLALTPVGHWTIQRLRLNRSPLVLNRLSRQERANLSHQIRQYRDVVRLLSELLAQQQVTQQEQAELLHQYRLLLNALDRSQ